MEKTASPNLFAVHALSEQREEEDRYFEQLRQTVFWECAGISDDAQKRGHARRMYLCESGWVDPGRRYFYLKPFGRPGWLFERSGSGWVVSRCEKIVAKDLFLRKGEPWDVVSLFKLEGGKRLRVGSSLAGDEIVNFSLYEKLMVNAVREEGGVSFE